MRQWCRGRTGNSRWRRLTEERSGRAKSVFHFDVQGSVAKPPDEGIPWLRFIRQRLGDRVHFWPFDGWEIPVGRSVVTEVYPALWSWSFARADRTGDQHALARDLQAERFADAMFEIVEDCSDILDARRSIGPLKLVAARMTPRKYGKR